VSSIDSHDSNTAVIHSGSTDVAYDRTDALAVASRLSGVADRYSTVQEFDPSKSYGQTRTEFEAAFEQGYVAWLLARHSGNISAAAREARMDRKHLHDLAKKHGLRGPAAARR
jgi:DNA-binding NtrC family response regulator